MLGDDLLSAPAAWAHPAAGTLDPFPLEASRSAAALAAVFRARRGGDALRKLLSDPLTTTRPLRLFSKRDSAARSVATSTFPTRERSGVWRPKSSIRCRRIAAFLPDRSARWFVKC